MSKLNFSIALKMTTEQFKRGADIVKNSLRQIQFQAIAMAGALGLGSVGLKNMVSRFVDVARETTRARVALKNISGGVEGFTRNMDFLLKTSKKWGQELNGMTAEFSKFSAAASSAGIPIEEQHTIFESFTRSITAFGMSSEDAHLSYLALSQMMSKGKVSSEELRRQLGERMPVAMEAMARAVGVTIQELDGLLKAGKLISKEVMLPFVQEMEKMLPEVNVDNIETSVNRLKNTFTKLTQDLKIGEYFKKIVDWANGMLSNIQTSFARIALVIVNSIAGAKIFGALSKLRTETANTNAKILAEKQRTELQKQVAVSQRVAAENKYNDFASLYEKNTGEQTFANKLKLYNMEKSLDKARLREKATIGAFEVAQAAKTTTIWTAAWRNIKTVAVTTFATIKAAMMSIVPMAIIGLLTNFVMKLVEARKEAQRIKSIFSDNKQSLFNIADNSDIQKIQTLHRIVKERLGTEEEINNAHTELLKALDIEKGRQVDLTKEVNRRVLAIKEAARAELAGQRNAELEQKNRDIITKMTPKGDMIAFGQFWEKYQKMKEDRPGQDIRAITLTIAKEFGLNASNNQLKELEENLRTIDFNNKILENAVKKGVGTPQGSTQGAPSVEETSKSDKKTDLEKNKETALQKAEREYTETLIKITNWKESGAISTEEHNKAIDALNEATQKEIGGLLGREAIKNETFNKANAGTLNKLHKEDKEAAEIEKYTRYIEEQRRLKDRLIITEEEYNKRVKEIAQSTLTAIGVMDDISEEGKNFIEKLKSDIKPPREKGKYSEYTSDELNKESKKIKREVFNEIKSGISDVTSLTDAFQSLNDVLKDTDATGLEKTMAVIDGIMDGIDRVWSFIESIDGVKDAIQSLNEVKSAQNALNNASAITEQTNALGDLGNVATQTATQVVAAKTSEATANTAAAATGAASSVSSIPYVGPILAIAAVASVLAALANLPKFASGGVVPGSSFTGDKVLARVNSGEMILNKGHQANLFKALSGGYSGSLLDNGRIFDGIKPHSFNNKPAVSFPKELKFEIEGRKLVSILKAEGQRSSRM